MDPAVFAREREHGLYSRIQARIGELEKLPRGIRGEPLADLSVDIKNHIATPSQLKLRAVTELKAPKLLPLQREIRRAVLVAHTRSSSMLPLVSLDRAALKMPKRATIREVRSMDQLEKQQRVDRERKKKARQLEFFEGVAQQADEVKSWHKKRHVRMQRLGLAVVRLHARVERDEKLRVGRNSKERLRALQEDAQASERWRKTGKLDYYGVAHRIVESVSTQPNILSGGRLKEYQIKGLEWMDSLHNSRLNGILADEMSLGKTIQTISLISYLVERKCQPGPFLLIVSLSTLSNWASEFEKWAPTITKVVYNVAQEARKALQKEIMGGNFNVLLTTYDFITRNTDRRYLSKIKWAYMIIDGPSYEEQGGEIGADLTKHYSSRHRLILTVLLSLLNLICPKIFDSAKTFDEWFNSPFKGQAVAGLSQNNVALNEEEQLLIIKRLHKVLRPFLLRRLKNDVESQLPEKNGKSYKLSIQHSATTSLRPNQEAMACCRLRHRQGNPPKSGVNSLNNADMHLRKVCKHPFVFQEVRNAVDQAWTNKMLLYRVSGKFELLDRVFPKFFATGHKVLMFFQMTNVVDIFAEFCEYRGNKVFRLDGRTKSKSRAEMMRRFNDPDNTEFKLFILSIKVGGLGLNLQAADTVIIFDSDLNPQQDLQAQDRAHRTGQTKEVKIFRLVSLNSGLQAGKSDNKSTNKESDEFLRSLFGAGSGEDGAGEGDEDETDEGAEWRRRLLMASTFSTPHTQGRGRRSREGATLNGKELAKRQWEDSEESDEGEGNDMMNGNSLLGDKRQNNDNGSKGNRKHRFEELAYEDDEEDEMFIGGGRSKRGRPKKLKLV
ncbi:hypothetical protein M427DRAFT_44280 [Gonapodya prolifera JEL478]|uniref:P-loop containing nucleoside triphosphate hydrolase protein n=1 Tax=Gonapodya prolifera (strain JEL478) TaxID=1344416 RepID=A0A139AFS0_GONPJ|nr:hypothetical protein M427DRAFT_44280 [Gonapodya prolifera JEL478]|eukprot:KXS15661.1 hypothetical protein M427DRAFT_44280 [Gonapodya prolifera JEL478]